MAPLDLLAVAPVTRVALEHVAAVAAAAIAAWLLCACLGRCSCTTPVWACDELCRVVLAVRALQPSTDEGRAGELARVFVAAGAEVGGVDPLLLVALAMRESSLRGDVERLERRGAHGELGLMQIHPRGPALRLRPAGCSATLEGAACQVRTGARWLAFVREQCPGSTWRWVAAYGWSRCPTEVEARADRAARVAEEYYRRVGGGGW